MLGSPRLCKTRGTSHLPTQSLVSVCSTNCSARSGAIRCGANLTSPTTRPKCTWPLRSSFALILLRSNNHSHWLKEILGQGRSGISSPLRCSRGLERNNAHASIICTRGNTNMGFFHLRVNGRRLKNFIHRLRHNIGWVASHEERRALCNKKFQAQRERGVDNI